ncbi:MAG TPA: MlaD family protein [Pseudobdellovibrionaceae bacterium]|jgi:phospholipid/cholesterol/gamma-HCH transport system substrate-binding protein
MNWVKSPEFKVGLLVVVVGSLIAFMSMQVSEDPSYLGRSKKAWFLLKNADGLVKDSAIRTAGIPIGIIRDIILQDGQARVDITVKSEVHLTVSAVVEIRAQGILGDKHVEINPGVPSDPPLPEGAQILNVKEKGSLDNLVGEVSEISSSLKTVSETLKEAITEDGTRKHILGRIVSNIEKLTGDIAQVTGENKEKIGEIVDQVHDVTSTLSNLVNDEGEDGFKKSWKKAVASLSRLDSIMKNVDEISGKINRGEGTIGKLVNDESTVEGLNTTIEGISGMMETANRIQTGFDFHAEYLGEVKATKSTVGIYIQPGLDRYYYLGIVDDPAGVIEREGSVSTTNGVVTTTDQTKTFYNKTKFSLLFAKNFYNLTLRGGLIENQGGIGIDYLFFRRKLKLSLEAFDFSKLNLRAQAQYSLSHGIYVLGGMTDMMDKSDRRSGYLGAGIYITNDDLKLLLSSKSPF